MAEDSLPLPELMCKAGVTEPQDFLRKAIETTARMLMEMEVFRPQYPAHAVSGQAALAAGVS